ncbi:MAG TPA: HIT family protein [Gemmatales bacterium]|nr:HIT family protein [Gemmatales bacterium]
MTCPLCEKIEHYRQKHAAELVAEFHESVVFLGPWQYYEGYCIVTARQHYTELFEMSAFARHALMDEVARVAKAIHAVVKPRKINYEWLGNQVPHLHWHLFPRQQSDPHHLQAAWLDIALAEKDVALKERWQECQRGRAKLIGELQAALKNV